MNEDDLRSTLTRVAQHAAPEPDSLDRLKAGRHRYETRRRNTFAATAVAGVAALAVLAIQVLPNGASGDPPGFATGGPGSPKPITLKAERVAFINNDGELKLYDPQTDELVPFATGAVQPGNLRHRFPAYTEDGTLRWVTIDGSGNSVVRETDPDATPPTVEVLIETLGEIVAASYGPEGQVAYMVRDGDSLVVRVATEPDPTRPGKDMWTFPPSLGRGISSEDSVKLAWSPDGSYLLVVNTFVDTAETRQDETLLVLGADGSKVMGPVNGTHGLWIDANRFAYMPYLAADGDLWRVHDITTGDEDLLDLDLPGSARPELSPDGKKLAVEDVPNGEIVIYTLESGSQIRFPGSGPTWTGTDEVMISVLEPCDPDRCPAGEPWIHDGTAVAIEISEDASRDLTGITHTGEAAVLWVSTTQEGRG